MTGVTHLLTTVDIDDRDAQGTSVSALHQAVLEDGARVDLLNDRGWSAKSIPSDSAEELVRTATVVVGPDEPFGDRSQTDMESAHWEALSQKLRAQGVVAPAATLSGLPHHVQLSDRLLARTGPQSAADPDQAE